MQRASIDALAKLNPRVMMKNPVMFVVELGSVLTTALLLLSFIALVKTFACVWPATVRGELN